MIIDDGGYFKGTTELVSCLGNIICQLTLFHFLLCSASTIDVAATRSCIGNSTPVATSSTADAVVGSAIPKKNCSFLSLPITATFGPLPLRFVKPVSTETNEY